MDIGVFRPDGLWWMPRVVREHRYLLVAHPLEALNVQVPLPGEHVDPVAGELSNTDVDEERIAVLDRGRHRLAPACHHLQMEMLFELDAHLAQVLGADAHVLKHLGIVVRDLPAAHRRADIVVGNPNFVAYSTWAVIVEIDYTTAIVGLSRRKQTLTRGLG